MALVPKKSVALQAGWAPSPDVAPVLGRSGADVAVSSASQAPPTVVSEEVARSVPPAVQATESEAGRMEEDTTGWSSSIMAVVESTSRGSPLALMSGGSCSPARGEPPL